MWTPIVLAILGALKLVNADAELQLDPIASRILREALADGIELAPFNFTAPALQEIVAWAHFDARKSGIPEGLLCAARNATTVDVHGMFSACLHWSPVWI
jgi:hypothetical protein